MALQNSALQRELTTAQIKAFMTLIELDSGSVIRGIDAATEMPGVWELIVSDETHQRLWLSPIGLQERSDTELASATEGEVSVLFRPNPGA